jgi:hypothetical protein
VIAAAAAFPSGFPSPSHPPGLAFFFHFLGIKLLAKLDPIVEKLIKFTLGKQTKFLNLFVKNGKI